jgi:hypothetical protein
MVAGLKFYKIRWVTEAVSYTRMELGKWWQYREDSKGALNLSKYYIQITPSFLPI